MDVLHFFLNVWLNKRELHICFCIQSVTLCCFDWSIWRKSSFIQIIAGERNLLIAFADNCEYSLVLHQKSVSNNFLKVNCNIESITVSVSFFILYYIKSTDLSLHFEWTLFLIHDYNSMHWFIWKTWVTLVFYQVSTHFIKQLKDTCGNINIYVTRKVFKYWGVTKFKVVNTNFQKF